MYSSFVDQQHIAREKAKARLAKKSRWWQQKTAQGTCHYCGQKFSFSQLTMDHIVPMARGGFTTPGNCVPACRPCNKEKGCSTILDILTEVMDRNPGDP